MKAKKNSKSVKKFINRLDDVDLRVLCGLINGSVTHLEKSEKRNGD